MCLFSTVCDTLHSYASDVIQSYRGDRCCRRSVLVSNCRSSTAPWSSLTHTHHQQVIVKNWSFRPSGTSTEKWGDDGLRCWHVGSLTFLFSVVSTPCYKTMHYCTMYLSRMSSELWKKWRHRCVHTWHRWSRQLSVSHPEESWPANEHEPNMLVRGGSPWSRVRGKFTTFAESDPTFVFYNSVQKFFY